MIHHRRGVALRPALACLVALLAPSLAHAETALLLPPIGEAALQRAREAAQQVLANALESQAVRIVSQAEAMAKLGGVAKDCKSIDCAIPLLQATGADVAAMVAVWGTGSPPAPSLIYVTLVDRRGDRYPARIRIVDDDLAATVKQALLEARALQLLGPGPWLRVRAQPEGAEVVLDGKTMGTAPFRAPIQPGRHTLEVRLDGYRPQAQTVDVPPTEVRQVEVDVDLARRGASDTRVPAERHGELAVAAADAVADTSEPARAGRPVVGPLLLGGAGAALILFDVGAHLVAIAGGTCRHRPPGSEICTQKTEVNIVPTIAYGFAGAGAIVGAVLWYVLGDTGASEEQRVQVSIAPDMLSVAAHF